ncbi:MAG: SufD family Fe-S cluster assembly protein [Collinsella sp.]
MQDTASKMGIVYSGIERPCTTRSGNRSSEEVYDAHPATDHKFAALHGAVWSRRLVCLVPKGTKLDFPLQSYFRLNAKGAGQFEHTLIIVEDDADLHFIEGCSAPKYNVANLHAGAVELFVGKRAHLRYSTIENWSKNMYNLNTKRARVDEDGDIGGSAAPSVAVGYLYPHDVLSGRRARSSFTALPLRRRPEHDTGKVVLNAPILRQPSDQGHLRAAASRPSAAHLGRQAGFQGNRELPVAHARRPEPLRTIPAMDIRAKKNVDIGRATIGHRRR